MTLMVKIFLLFSTIQGDGAAIAGLEAGPLARVHCQGGYSIVALGKNKYGKGFGKWSNPYNGAKENKNKDVKAECEGEEQCQTTLAWVQIILFARQHRFTHK